jgi:hypothetical protein
VQNQRGLQALLVLQQPQAGGAPPAPSLVSLAAAAAVGCPAGRWLLARGAHRLDCELQAALQRLLLGRSTLFHPIKAAFQLLAPLIII